MKIHTIEAEYEYRMVKIVKRLIKDIELTKAYIPKDGDELEVFLEDHKIEFAANVLDDIQEWMGFDELLQQVKDKST